jgi:hypothetical protein
VFFWSEEHAIAFRKKTHRARVAYFLPEQMAYATRIIQTAIFQFNDKEDGALGQLLR